MTCIEFEFALGVQTPPPREVPMPTGMTEGDVAAWVAAAPEGHGRVAFRGVSNTADDVLACSHYDGTTERCADVRQWWRPAELDAFKVRSHEAMIKAIFGPTADLPHGSRRQAVCMACDQHIGATLAAVGWVPDVHPCGPLGPA